jgi:SAM-dependent methyltransferase
MITSDKPDNLSKRIAANDRLCKVNFPSLIQRTVQIKPGEAILDVGCGLGQITAMLAKKNCGAFTVGLDINPESVERANHLFAAEGLNHVQAYVHDAAQVPFYTGEMELQESAFDVVVATSSIYNIGRLNNDYDVSERQQQALDNAIQEIYRVLKPGGRFIANSPTLANTRDLLRIATAAGAKNGVAIKQIRLPEVVTFQGILPAVIKIFDRVYIAKVQNPIVYTEKDIATFIDYLVSSDFWTHPNLLSSSTAKSNYLATIVRQVTDAILSNGKFVITKEFLIFLCYKLSNEELPEEPFMLAIREWPNCMKEISVATAFQMGESLAV